MGDFKTIDLFNGICNIPLAHSFRIHRQNLTLNAAYIPGTLWYRLRFKGSIPVPWDIHRNVPIGCFNRFMAVSVSAVIRGFVSTVVGFIAKVGIHLSLKHGFKHWSKYVFERCLHILGSLWLVFINNCLCNSHTSFIASVFSGCHNFCTHKSFHPFFRVYRTLS